MGLNVRSAVIAGGAEETGERQVSACPAAAQFDRRKM
jgi:hypothetical protein